MSDQSHLCRTAPLLGRDMNHKAIESNSDTIVVFSKARQNQKPPSVSGLLSLASSETGRFTELTGLRRSHVVAAKPSEALAFREK